MMDWMLSAPTGVARLPALGWQQIWLVAAWAAVIAWLGSRAVGRWTTRQDVKLAVSASLALWVVLPGSWGLAHWLGLAFQAPSVTTVLLCALPFFARLFSWGTPSATEFQPWPPQLLFLGICGVILGWALLLDTLGVFTGSLYNWGFGAYAPVVALTVAALPWVFTTKTSPHPVVVLLLTATLLFVVVRLPTGNLFDALLDPWLWGFLQFALIQQWRYRSRKLFS